MTQRENRPHPTLAWEAVCAAITDDLSERLSVVEMRSLMHRVGARLARSMPLPRCDSLADLERVINARLAELGWGSVTVQERDDAIVLAHAGAGLDAALGSSSRPWAPALLEGAYEQWMRSVGAGRGLAVCQRATSFNVGDIEFHLRPVASVA